MCRSKFRVLMLLAVFAVPCLTMAKAADKSASMVDSGSFSIFVGGQRVATETFTIQQKADVSVANSELKSADGRNEQRSELQITPTGNLKRYEWREVSPGKSQAVVEPSEDILIERITVEPGSKPAEKPFILPPSTPVLDDYVFSQRQILLWRYLAQVCGNELAKCHPQKTQFGVLIPHQQLSASVTIEYLGPEKTTVRGQDRVLNRFNISSEDNVWAVWVDVETLKVVRMEMGNTEVVRD